MTCALPYRRAACHCPVPRLPTQYLFDSFQ